MRWLRSRSDREIHGLAADVGEPGAPQRIVNEAAALVGPIDLLINNASTLGPVPLRLLLDTDCEDFEQVLAVNLVGPFQLAQGIAGGSMALRGGGTIVNLSSDAAVEAVSELGSVRRLEGGARPPEPNLGGRARRRPRARPHDRSRRDGHRHASRRDPGRGSEDARGSEKSSPRRSSRSSPRRG